MSNVFSWLLKEYEEGAFSGSLDITLGMAAFGYFGSREVHTFGSDRRLVVSSQAMVGRFLSPATGVLSLLLGLQGEASYCFGTRTTLTYGGPVAEIRRGPVIRRISPQPVGFIGWGPYAGAAEDSPEAVQLGEQPAALEMAAEDTSVCVGVLVLSELLTLVTAGLELAIRFKFSQYNQSTGETTQFDPANPNATPDPSEAVKLDLALKIIPSRLMELIYWLEMAGSWSALGTAMLDSAASLAKKALYVAAAITVIPGLILLYTRAEDETQEAIKSCLKVIAITIVIAAVTVALAFGVAAAIEAAGS